MPRDIQFLADARMRQTCWFSPDILYMFEVLNLGEQNYAEQGYQIRNIYHMAKPYLISLSQPSAKCAGLIYEFFSEIMLSS